ncbi:MAG TPA: hypothetical protein QGF58_30895 [Myxococcota bacterium]|nr:hypothetical protein [Myxococcota bacterium]
MAAALLALACAPATEGWLITAQGRVVDLDGTGVAAAVAVSAEGALVGEVDADSEGYWSLPIIVEEDQQVPLVVVAWDGDAVGTTWSTLEVFEQPTPSELFVGSGQRMEPAPVWMPAVTVATPEDATLSGQLVDGSTGEPAGQVSIALVSGWNAPADGNVVALAASDHEGSFSAEVPAGVYTAYVRDEEGVEDAVFPASTASLALGVVVPPLAEEELVMALSHDGTLELDLHTTGPRAGTDGTGQPFDVYSDRQAHPDRGEPVAALIVEDPRLEVGWIYERRVSGVYRAVVFDSGGMAVVGNEDLGNSRPVVQFWSAEGPAMAQATPGRVGTHWVALRLDLDRAEIQRPEDYGEDANPSDPMTF